MAGFFRYAPQQILSGQDRFRHFLNFSTSHTAQAFRIIVPVGTTGTITSPTLSALGSGNAPQAVLAFCLGDNFDVFDDLVMSIGCATSPTNRWSGGMWCPFGDTGQRSTTWKNDVFMTVPYQGFECDLVSFDPNGLTLNVTSAPGGGDIRIIGLALWHPSGTNFASGTAVSGSGSQSITCGFQPSMVYLASSQQTVIGPVTNTYARLAIGAADISNGGYSIWTGGKASEPYINQVAQSGYGISFLEDSDATFGPTHPTVLSHASVTFDPTGFTLNWSGDGASRYFGWLAVRDDVESNRFVYNHTLSSEITDVATRAAPVGLYFFQNDQGTEDLSLHTPNQAMGVGLGVVDSSLTKQEIGSTAANDAHTFPFNDINTRQINVFAAFGCIEKFADSLVAGDPRDYGQILAMGQVAKRSQIIRYR